MRAVKILALAFLLCCVIWAASAWGLRKTVSSWFAEQARQGWLAEYQALNTGGFPIHHDLRIIAPMLADPGTGAAWRAEWLRMRGRMIWPSPLRITFPDSPQRLSYFDQTATLTAQGMIIDLALAPGNALKVETLMLSSGPLALSLEGAPRLRLSALVLDMQHIPKTETQYEIKAEVAELSPEGVLRQQLNGLDDLPQALSDLRLKATIEFDTEWDRRALEQQRPQPRFIALDEARAQWADLLLRLTGELSVDEFGRLTGDLAVRAENWRSLLSMAERVGLLPPQMRSGIDRVLSLFARQQATGDTLDIVLTLQQGQIWLGPLPVGTAPNLILR